MTRFLKVRRMALTLTAAALGVSGALAYAQVGGGFDLSWSTIDGGGGTFSTGGSYSLGGTIGQHDSGSMSGGTFTLDGGFWGASAGGPTPTITPVPATIRGHVTWQGRPAQPNALQQLPITLTIKSGSTETNYPVQTTDASGLFTVSVSGLPTGTYNWRVKGPDGVVKSLMTDPPGFLANAGTLTLTGAATTQVEMGLMKAGDCNNDNTVSVSDFNILKNTFGRSQGQTGYDSRAEITGDLTVSISDFNLLKTNFGAAGNPPLGPSGERSDVVCSLTYYIGGLVDGRVDNSLNLLLVYATE